jgi:hypothetical protein
LGVSLNFAVKLVVAEQGYRLHAKAACESHRTLLIGWWSPKRIKSIKNGVYPNHFASFEMLHILDYDKILKQLWEAIY